MTSSDELVKRAMEGERDAFGKLIRQYEKPLFIFLHRKVKNEDLALDILQETFIDALVALPGLRDPERFQSWLFTIARRKAWLARRTASDWDEIMEPIPIICSASDEVLRKELSEVVQKAVGTLPEKMRDVVQMHYLDELPYAEVCKKLGIPVSTLKSRLHEARKQLRDGLTPFVEDMPEVRSALKRRKISMKLSKPDIRVQEVPGVEMEVDVVEPPNCFIKLEEGAKGGGVWFRNWVDSDGHAYRVFSSHVVGRALVEGEECWEIEREMRTPEGKLSSTTTSFYDRRADGFYLFATISRGEEWTTELHFSSPPVPLNFPNHISLGMKSFVYGKEKMKVERVVDVRINGKTTRALETVYPSASFEAEGGKVLRLSRTYIGADGRNVLYERYHSIEERASGVLPDDVPEIEYGDVKYLLYFYVVPTRFVGS